MSKNIGKIKLGKKDKRSFFDMSHSIDSTCSAGFVEPCMCLDCIPNTKIDLHSFPGVRLAPLPQPTTGKVKVKSYYSYVHTEDVFEAFESLQSSTEVTSSRGTYTPMFSNTIKNQLFFLYLLGLNTNSYRKILGLQGDYTNRDMNGVLATYSISSNYDLWTGADAPVHNLFDDVRARGLGSAGNNENYKALAAYYQTVNYMGAVADAYIAPKCCYTGSVATIVENQKRFFDEVAFGEFLPWVQLTSGNYDAYVYGEYMNFMRNLSHDDSIVFSRGRSVTNADFVFKCPISYGGKTGRLYRADNTEWGQPIDLTGKEVYIGIHLTPAGKRLFKIFNACEFNFGYLSEFETDKLLAYYKAWFDIFNPGRNLQWKATNAYALIHSFYDSPTFSWQTCIDAFLTHVTFNQAWETASAEFIIDLVECFYTERVDPITVATASPVLNNELSISDNVGVRLYSNSDNEGQSYHDGYGQLSEDYGGLSIRFLTSLYHLVNKNSVIGQRVALYMKEHFGIDVPKTSFIDVKSFDVDIVDATSTVNNDQTLLGEYAGKGIGKSENGITFETKKHGYLFQFVVIVPVGGYVQAGKKAKRFRTDWYQPEWDSVGMEPLSSYEVNSRNYVVDAWKSSNPEFGFRPRYFAMKYKNNVHNGGFSFRSERSQFLGYSLDKVFSEPDYYLNEEMVGSDHGFAVDYKGGLKLYPGVILAPDEELRYIGKNEQFGNYDRIFYDTTGMTDNYILHVENDLKMYAPMKAISESYDTYDETSDTDVTSVEHS